jgi:hypothetical protein
VKKILVIGAGTAGLLTLSQFCSGLDDDWDVYSVYDPSIPILGVGEATSTNAPLSLFKGTDFILGRDGHYVDGTYKFSVKYTNWRKTAFDSVIFPPAHAIHFDNTRLKDFVFMRLKERYPKKFKVIEGNVSYMKNIPDGVEVKINGEIKKFDYVIDCGGFPKDFTGYNMVDLPLNHALVVRVNEPGTWDYTHHWAHKHGWMFGIPLKSKQGWGYLYNDEITSKEDAIEDLCEILKLDKHSIEPREFSFKPYYALDNLIDGRIFKNGNRYMFFEPMEALSMEYYSSLNSRYLGYIHGQATKERLLSDTKFDLESLIMFYRFIYHGGSIYDTDFWKITKKTTTLNLKNSQIWNDMLNFWKEHSYDPNVSINMEIAPFRAYTWEQFDKNLGYGYFVKPHKDPRKKETSQIKSKTIAELLNISNNSANPSKGFKL